MNCLEEASKSDVKQENLSEPVVTTKKEPESEQVKTVNDQAKKKEDDGAMLFVKNLNFKTGKFQYYNYSINFTTERDRKKKFSKIFSNYVPPSPGFQESIAPNRFSKFDREHTFLTRLRFWSIYSPMGTKILICSKNVFPVEF